MNFYSWELIKASIESIPPSACGKIVVLDNSNDLEEWARLLALQSTDRRLSVHRSSSNVGFGAAMNSIAKLDVGHPEDVIWLLNPDTEVLTLDPDEVRRVLNDGLAIVSPMIVQGRASEVHRVWFDGGTVDIERGLVQHLRFGDEVRPGEREVHRTEFMTGAAPLMYRRTFDRLGGFDERLFLYWEDVDLSIRAARLGLHMAVLPSAVVWHLEGGSGEGEAGRSRRYHRYMARNRLVVSRRHGARLTTLLIGAGAVETLKIVARPLVREHHGKLGKALAALVGTLEGAASPVSSEEVTRP
ncbi:glycosyltransferase [Curtobacterium sp. 9128]|uniref:glycosyltransferase n=1 Tax=Curtobacterium sp. 9128 TaxID=1793722 RepID=UPI0016429130|nr:glycosyltransferase family 2 protein [Curtobacterium sp. 9128]